MVRRWQQLVSTSSQTNSINGDGIANRLGVAPPSGIPHHLQNAGFGSKPASPGSRPGTPSSGKSNLSPASIANSGTATPASRPGTPSGAIVQSKVSPKLSVVRPMASGPKPASPALNSVNTSNFVGKRTSPTGNHAPGKNSVVHRSSTPTEGLGKTHVANKRKRRKDDISVPGMKVARLEENSNEGAQQNHSHAKIEPKVNGIASDSPHLDTSQKDLQVCNTQASSNIPTSKRVSPPLSECDEKTNTKPGLLARRNVTLPAGTKICDTKNRPVYDETPVSASSDRSDKNRFDRTPHGTNQTPKVKTTAQLIKELYASGDLRLAPSETVTKIALNQIEKEEDLSEVSIVPPEAKPRPRRKPGTANAPPGTPNESLSKTKTEMVQKFLQSSITPSTSELELANLVEKDDEGLLPRVSSHTFLANLGPHPGSQQFFNSIHADAVHEDEPDGGLRFSGKGLLGNEGIVNGARIENTDISDPWSLLPPLDLDNVNLDDDDYVPLDVPEPDEFSVDRLHNEHWSGVNGQLDSLNSWHDWTVTYTMPSYNSEPIHLLPYVNIDE